MNDSRKSIFKDIKIVNLPFSPFQKEANTELEIINFISSSIIKIETSKRREFNQQKQSKIFNFRKCETVVAIDISSFEYREISYIENLYHIMNLYPFICINCSIDRDSLNRLRIHAALKGKGYILPFIPRINPIDTLSTSIRYGDEFLNLISGNINKLELTKLDSLDKYYTIDDIISHFPNVSTNGTFLTYELPISWIGVTNTKIVSILNYLFDNNVDNPFSINKICSEFEAEISEIMHYITNSMLFDYLGEDSAIFRFHKKNIIPKIQSELLGYFENELNEKGAIDTKSTEYGKFDGTFYEYHELGRLFHPNETYSIKLITDLRHMFSDIEYDGVVMIDNGLEDNLYLLLKNILSKPITVRIVNNIGSPQLYPFEKINYGKKYIVVTDVINNGTFLPSVINLINNEMCSEVNGVFSFIINNRLELIKLREKCGLGINVPIKYYIEKELHNVKDTVKEKQRQRRQNSSDERFLFFWNTINKFGGVKRQYYTSGSRDEEFFDGLKSLKTIFLQSVSLKGDTDDFIVPNSDLISFMKDLIEECQFTGCIINNESSTAEVFSRILEKFGKVFAIKSFDFSKFEQNDELKGFYEKQSALLICDDGINLGQNILRIIKSFDEDKVVKKNNISICSLILRKNVRKSNDHISDKYHSELMKLVNKRVRIYYYSSLPYYLLTDESEHDRSFSGMMRRVYG